MDNTNVVLQNMALVFPVSRQFLKDVLCTAIEGGSNYWAAFDQPAMEPGQFVSEYIRVRVTECGDDGPSENALRVTVNLDKMAEGCKRLIQGGMFDKDIPGQSAGSGDAHVSYRMQVLQAVIEDDAGQIDVSLADLVLQAAVLGCIRYG